jgi:hypothetical protein
MKEPTQRVYTPAEMVKIIQKKLANERKAKTK